MAQLVARVLWEHDAAGSSPVTPTISSVHNESDEHSIFLPIFRCLEQLFCSFLLCRGGQIVYRNALSALKTIKLLFQEQNVTTRIFSSLPLFLLVKVIIKLVVIHTFYLNIEYLFYNG